MKKVLACVGAILVSAGIFLLLPWILPENERHGLSLYPIVSLLFGGFIPFIGFGDRAVMGITVGAFAAFAWAGGILHDVQAASILCIVGMLAGALGVWIIKCSLPIRFERCRLPLKLIFAVLQLAALIGVFFILAAYRPDSATQMELDMYHYDLIFVWFPLFSLAYGLTAPFFSYGDKGFLLLSLAAFVLFGLAGLLYSGFMEPVGILLYLPILLSVSALGNWLFSAISPHRTNA